MAARKPLKKRVGRSVEKKPETLNIEEVLEATPVEVVKDSKPYCDSMGMTVDPAQEAAAKSGREQEAEWDKIKVRWAPETRHQVMSDFLRTQGLYGELAKFASKRIR